MDASKLPLLEKGRSGRDRPALKAAVGLLKAAALLTSDDKAQRMAAAKLLADSGDPSTKSLLLARLAEGAETDTEVRTQLKLALSSVASKLAWAERLGHLVHRGQFGSILLLVALGLAITYGLMGVINMAHGEPDDDRRLRYLRGAEPCSVSSCPVPSTGTCWPPYRLPSWLRPWWVLCWSAACCAGCTAAAGVAVGHLGHQSGADAIGAHAVWSPKRAGRNPGWLSGGVAVLPNLTLPYNRLAILALPPWCWLALPC